MTCIRKSLLILASLAVLAPAAFAAGAILTRFGTLTISGQFSNQLSFHGRRIIKAMNPLSVSDHFRMARKDVLLIQESGGTACPATYYFVTVNASGAKSTPAFGTCNTFTSVDRKGPSITVAMRGFQGPFEPAAKRRKAFAETHIFVFRDGKVREEQGRVR